MKLGVVLREEIYAATWAASIKLSMSKGRIINPAFCNAYNVLLNAWIERRRRTGGGSDIPSQGTDLEL